MSFNALLRRTKLVTIPEPISPSIPERSDAVRSVFPTRQVITAPKACRAQGDWGLKRNLPLRKTSMIEFTDLDTVEHQTPFKSANDTYLKRERFQELWIDLRVGYSTTSMHAMAVTPKDPDAFSLATMGKAEFERLVEQVRARRQEFLQYLKDKLIDLDTISLKELEAETEDFLGIKGVPLRIPKTAPNAGLSYAPPALSNPTDGSSFGERIVPARFLRGRDSGRVVHALGVGGFTTVLNTTLDNIRQKTRDRARIMVKPTKAVIHASGNLQLSVESYSPETNAAREKRADEIDSWAALFPLQSSKKQTSEEGKPDTAQGTNTDKLKTGPSADYAKILGVLDDYKRVSSTTKVKKFATEETYEESKAEND